MDDSVHMWAVGIKRGMVAFMANTNPATLLTVCQWGTYNPTTERILGQFCMCWLASERM